MKINEVYRCAEKEKIINECIKSFTKLLPDINPKDRDEAIEACYRDGITVDELKKACYAYLYPAREPSLY